MELIRPGVLNLTGATDVGQGLFQLSGGKEICCVQVQDYWRKKEILTKIV
jgi:hypothetical protein